MSNQLTRRNFAIRTAGFGLALGLAPAATLAEAEQASRSKPSPAIADPYSLVDPELLPALKQFPAFDFSAEMAGKFRQLPAMPPLLFPRRSPWSGISPGRQEQTIQRELEVCAAQSIRHWQSCWSDGTEGR